MKKLLITLLKVGISVAIIAWLVVRAQNDRAFSHLWAQYRDPGFAWGMLAAACLCCAMAVAITVIRWYYLVRALEMRFSLQDAFRMGFLGYLFNLAPMGIVGGDLLKAIMLARQQPGRRAQAFATVAVDRVIGLYVLFVVASVAILLTGFWNHAVPEIRYISAATLLVTAISSAGMAVLFIPGATKGRLTKFLGELRYIGRALEHLIEAMRMYRRRVSVLFASAMMSVGVHSLFAVGIYLITVGIYTQYLEKVSLGSEFVVSPLSSATGVIPLVMGPMEAVLDFLYAQVFGLNKSEGLVVALGYRIVTLLIATVGVCYYLSARREVAEVMHQAEQEEHFDEESPCQAVAVEPMAAVAGKPCGPRG